MIRNASIVLAILIAAPSALAGPGYKIPEPIKKRYQLQRAAHKRPARSTPDLERSAAPSSFAEGRLEKLEDGTVLLSREVSPEAIMVLERLGARPVLRLEDVDDHTLFSGRYYKRYSVAPKLASKEAQLALEIWVGKKVRLELVRMKTGRLAIASVRGTR